MNILIVEDETRSAKRLERLLNKVIKNTDVDIYWEQSVDSAQKFVENRDIDLLFLDLNLKGEDGFTILRQIVSKSFHTIIVSAHEERAIEAFEFGVLDFVPKPVIESRLEQGVERFYNQQRTENTTKYLTVKHKNNIELLLVEDILYLNSQGHYTEIHSQNESVRLHSKSLEKLLVLLPPEFERTHKSYIVNMNFVKKVNSFTGSIYKLELLNGLQLPLGRSRSRYIKNKLLNN